MAPRLEIHVRLYRPGDRDRVLRLAPRLIEGTAPWRDPAGTLRAVEVALRSAIDSFRVPGHAVFVAEADDDLVGLVTGANASALSASVRVTSAGWWCGPGWSDAASAAR
jgi:hypothetical protein